jgi:adenylate cyclase
MAAGERRRVDDRTLREVVEETGLTADYLRRHLLAMGLPMPGLDEPALDDADVAAWRTIKAVLDSGIPEDTLLEMVRVSGRGAARVAAVALDIAGDDVTAILGALGETPLRWHLRERLRREAIGRAEHAAGGLTGTTEVAVGVVALVEPDGRAPHVTARFERLATEVAGPPVELVKLVGDAALLVSPDPVALIEAAWALVGAAAAAADLPPARAGAALGPSLHRGGDWFGAPVDLAGRIARAAEPGAVFADEALARRTSEAVAWAPAGAKHLGGGDEPVALHRLRGERTGAGG